MLYHELEDGMYSVTSYFFAKVSPPPTFDQQGAALLHKHAAPAAAASLTLVLWSRPHQQTRPERIETETRPRLYVSKKNISML